MIWCSYRVNGRSPMSSNAIITRPPAGLRGVGRIARREPRRPARSARALVSERVRPANWVPPANRVHPAEQAYTAELAHAERVGASGEADAGARTGPARRPARGPAGSAPAPVEEAARRPARGQPLPEPAAAAEQPAPRAPVHGGHERRRWIA